jgi:hypothetical protein
MTSAKRIRGYDPQFLRGPNDFQETVATAIARLILSDFFWCAYLKEGIPRKKLQTAEAVKENIIT